MKRIAFFSLGLSLIAGSAILIRQQVCLASIDRVGPEAGILALDDFNGDSMQAPRQNGGIREDWSAYASAASDRAALKRAIKNGKCKLSKVGSLTAQRKCVKKRLRTIDSDKDGIRKNRDNCPSVSNNDQADGDSDGVGSACDNCPAAANTQQANQDGDAQGSACDNCPGAANSDQADTDGDAVGNACDNCPNNSNHDQADTDHDNIGNACDGDYEPSHS